MAEGTQQRILCRSLTRVPMPAPTRHIAKLTYDTQSDRMVIRGARRRRGRRCRMPYFNNRRL